MSGSRRSSACSLLFVLMCAVGLLAQPAKHGSARERLIGAWHLIRIDVADVTPGRDTTVTAVPQPKGMLIYTRDGHMSVQLMYPESAAALSNEYVLNG